MNDRVFPPNICLQFPSPGSGLRGQPGCSHVCRRKRVWGLGPQSAAGKEGDKGRAAAGAGGDCRAHPGHPPASQGLVLALHILRTLWML